MSTRRPAFTEMTGTADFSEDGRYRYSLTRTWDPRVERCGFIMLNPSTADANRSDATVTRCVNFARDWGYGGVIIRNLYGLRSTDPRELRRVDDPVGPDNDEGLRTMLQWLPRVVCAWGTHARPERVREFWQLAQPRLDERTGWGGVECLELTKDGHPRHPLYVPASRQPIPYRRPA